MTHFTGGCACGAVRYEITAAPLMSGHCQCGKCQRLSGGAHSSFAAFPVNTVAVTGPLQFWSYTADSGNTASRGFCSTCGSHVIAKSSGMKDMVAIQLGSLDDGAGIEPKLAFFTARGQSWDHLDGSLTKFPAMPPM